MFQGAFEGMMYNDPLKTQIMIENMFTCSNLNWSFDFRARAACRRCVAVAVPPVSELRLKTLLNFRLQWKRYQKQISPKSSK